MSARRAHRLLIPLATCALAFSAAPTPAIAAPADPAPLLLRLPDLGPGYVIESGGFTAGGRTCVRFELPTVDVDPIVKRLALLRPGGCLLSFERAWTPASVTAGPSLVDSAAFRFVDSNGPRQALADPRAFAAGAFGMDPAGLRVATPAPALGDEAALLRIDETIPRIHRRFSLGLVLWRSGSVLGMVRTGERYGDATVDAALRLAFIQQAHIATPTPLPPSVNDDRFVWLDDPTLDAPVLWLGERLPGPGRFPALRLHSTDHDFDPTEHPWPLVRLIYGTPQLPDTATIQLWRPRDLRAYLRLPPYPHQCRRRFEVAVPDARAWIRATYVRDGWREHGSCLHGGPSYKAVAFFHDVGVTIDANGCCRSGAHPAPAPARSAGTRTAADSYDSRAGLRTLLRALRPREPKP